MENIDLLSNDLQVTPQGLRYLTESAKWGKFLAIMGFISCGFLAILAFLIPVIYSQLPQNTSTPLVFNNGMKTGLTIVYLVLTIILFFPCLYLYKFSSKMQLASKDMGQENLDESLMNLKSMFKFCGIFTIIILSGYALVIIFSIVVAALH
jgi:Family of unknown function (DUF5362)